MRPDVSGADPRLRALVDQADELLPGGEPAFKERLDALSGLPVVVNKWASWCGPCRAEAPVLQQAAKQLGGKVAFLGVNMYDSDGAARSFMREFPLPYPSYDDPDFKISRDFPPVKSAPVTNFYDRRGRLVHSQPAQLDSARQVRELIERYSGPLDQAE